MKAEMKQAEPGPAKVKEKGGRQRKDKMSKGKEAASRSDEPTHDKRTM